MENLATEILHELKMNAKRWFIAFITVLILWFATIGVFIWYISLPVEEYYDEYTVEQDADRNGTNRFVGGDYYGETEGDQTTDIQAQGE